MGTLYTFESGARSTADVRAEVRAAARARQDDEERGVSDHCGNVTWQPVDTDHSPWSPDPPPEEVAVAQVVKSSWGDPHEGAHGYVFRRFDGESVPVDRFMSLAYDRDGVADYFLAAYDTVPYVHTTTPTLEPFDRDDRIPGARRPPPTDPDSDRRRRIVELLRGDGRDVVDLDELAPLLDDDEYFHLLAARLPEALAVEGTLDDRVLAWLQSNDRTERARAVRLVDAVTTTWQDSDRHAHGSRDASLLPQPDDRDAFELFLAAIPTVDETTQRLVARSLWKPWVGPTGSLPDPSYVTGLAALVDADCPEVRAGALHGAGRALGDLVVAAQDCTPGAPDSVASLEPQIAAFYDAYATALQDDHPLVRGRAASLAIVPLNGELRESHPSVVTEPLLGSPEFEQRWQVARSLAEGTADEDTAVAERSDVGPFDTLFDTAVGDDPDGLATLVAYAWEERGPQWEPAREVLAERAEADPAAHAEYVDAPVAAVESGSPVAADLAVLAALAPVATERVASVAEELASLLDRDDDLAAGAARTLRALRAERPDVVPDDAMAAVDDLLDPD